MIDKATEKKADGGRIGRKLGGGADMAKRNTNVQKIKETFALKMEMFQVNLKVFQNYQKQFNKKLTRN